MTLETDHREQIEELLGRPLSTQEQAQVASLDALTDAHRSVVRVLAARQVALCSVYLRSVAPVGVGAIKIFIDQFCREAG